MIRQSFLFFFCFFIWKVWFVIWLQQPTPLQTPQQGKPTRKTPVCGPLAYAWERGSSRIKTDRRRKNKKQRNDRHQKRKQWQQGKNSPNKKITRRSRSQPRRRKIIALSESFFAFLFLWLSFTCPYFTFFFRVFLNLGFAKPMVCVRDAFHENDGNHENDENGEDNSDSYKQGVEYWIRGNHGNDGNDENHENPGCKPRVPRTTGLEIPFGFACLNFKTLSCRARPHRSQQEETKKQNKQNRRVKARTKN